MGLITVKVFSNSIDLSLFASKYFARAAKQSVTARGRFTCTLAGGGTPQVLYSLLAAPPFLASLPWAKMHFFWGDERCVSPGDHESCYQQAYRTWLGRVPVPSENLHRIPGELGPQKAAADYAAHLQLFATDGLAWPRFDLVLLGLGSDGHTASLFPGSDQTSRVATVAVTAHYQDRPANRVSLASDVFNAARRVVFLAAGVEKANALAATLSGQRDLPNLPAQRIRLPRGRVWWLVDQAAASRLPGEIPGVHIEHIFAE